MSKKLNSELLTIHNRMTEINGEIRDLGKKTDPLQQQRYLISAKITLGIALELDDSGKKKYSNEQMRRAAVTIQLAENKEYQEILKAIGDFGDVRFQLKTEYEKLRNEKTFILIELGVLHDQSEDEI